MRKALLIAQREYLVTVRSKGFLIGLVLAPILMCGGFIGIKLTENRVDLGDKRVVVLDRSGLLGSALVDAAKARNDQETRDRKSGRKIRAAYILELAAPDERQPDRQRLELSDQVRQRRLHAFLDIGPGVLHPRSNAPPATVAYYAQNSPMDDVRRWIAQPLNDHLRKLRLADAGLKQDSVKDLFDYRPVEGMDLVSADQRTGQIKAGQRTNEGRAIGVPMALLMVMYLLVMIASTPQIQSVMEEKTQRIAEVILGCIEPFPFMLGKLLGSVAVTLTGSAVYIGAALAMVTSLGMMDLLPWNLLPWFMAFLVTAVLMMGSIFAALGSMCSEPKHAQSYMLPAMLPVLLPWFIMMPILKAPNSLFAVVTSLIPPLTPMLMVLRLSAPGGVPMWQAWVALAGVALFTLGTVWVGGRIFRMGLLFQGKPPSLPTLLRWAVRG